MPGSKLPSALNKIYTQIGPYLKTEERSGIIGDHNNGGYHPSRNNLAGKGKTRGEDYSLVAPADLRGDGDYACAIDIKHGLAEMRIVTTRLRVACTNNDPRIECMREFIGSLDGRAVCGYNRYDSGGSGSRSVVGWHPTGYGDSSHQWHVHISVFRDQPNNANAMSGLAEVIAGVKAGTFGWKPSGTTAPPVVVDPVMPIYYVDPTKVSTFLLGHRGDDPKKERPAGYVIDTGDTIVEDEGRKWLVTKQGWAYDLAFLTTVKPEVVVDPEPEEPSYLPPYVVSNPEGTWEINVPNGSLLVKRPQGFRITDAIRIDVLENGPWLIRDKGLGNEHRLQLSNLVIEGQDPEPEKPKFLPPYVVTKLDGAWEVNVPNGELVVKRNRGYRISDGVRIEERDNGKWLIRGETEDRNEHRIHLPYLTLESKLPPATQNPEPTPIGDTLRYAFWNTRRESFSGDHNTGRDWDKNRYKLANAFLDDIPGGYPDVLATCETTDNQTEDIAKHTKMFGIGNGINMKPYKDVSNDNNSVFLGKNTKFKRVIRVDTGTSSNPMAKRYLLAVEIEFKGETIWVGATHLNRGNTQAQKEKEITVLLNACVKAGINIKRFVLGMDANDSALSSDPGVRQAARDGFDMDDIRNRLSDTEFRGDSWDTFTGWSPEVEKTGRHIDVILVGSEIVVTQGEVVPVRNQASDHQMLLCTLGVQKKG